MKKILVVNQHYMTGGIKKSLSNLLPDLLKRYEVKVMFLCGDTSDFERQFPGVLVKTPFLLGSVLSPLQDLRKMNLTFIRVALKTVAVFLGKIVGAEKVLSFCIGRMKKLSGYDCAIAYSHDNWSEHGGFFGGANKIVSDKVDAPKKLAWMHGEPKTNGLSKERLFRTYRNFSEVITVSEACKAQFDKLAEGKVPCVYVRNMFDIQEIILKSHERQEQVGAVEEAFQIVTVGRLSKVAKRSDKINEVARLLRDNGYKFHWTVVGGGSEYEACVSKCREYGLEGEISYVGNKDNPYKFMKGSDVFVLVSDSEASSMVIYEALILGIPVITTDFPAAYESIAEGKNGFIVGKGVMSIYKGIAYCIDHKESLVDAKKYMAEHPIDNAESLEKIENLIG